MLPVSSKDNRHYKSAIRVRNGKEKGLVFVEGKRLALEAVKSRFRILEAFFSNEFLASGADGLIGAISDRADHSFSLPQKLFNSLAETKSPQGIALICARPEAGLDDLFHRKESGDWSVPAIIVLDRISNPGNLGAVLRTAEAAGAIGAVTTAGSVDAFSPAVLRGSMGAAFRLPVVEKQDLRQVTDRLRSDGFRIAATAAGSGEDYSKVDWSVPTAIVFGSEAHGLAESASGLADISISIPMEDEVESLNLAVSCGIILFEVRRSLAS